MESFSLQQLHKFNYIYTRNPTNLLFAEDAYWLCVQKMIHEMILLEWKQK